MIGRLQLTGTHCRCFYSGLSSLLQNQTKQTLIIGLAALSLETVYLETQKDSSPIHRSYMQCYAEVIDQSDMGVMSIVSNRGNTPHTYYVYISV